MDLLESTLIEKFTKINANKAYFNGCDDFWHMQSFLKNVKNLRVEPKVTFNKYLGYSKNSSGRSEPNSLYVIRVLVNKTSY